MGQTWFVKSDWKNENKKRKVQQESAAVGDDRDSNLLIIRTKDQKSKTWFSLVTQVQA